VIELASAVGIREDRPSFVDQAHLLCGGEGRIGALEIRVVAFRELPMRACDLERRRVAGDAQDRVRIDGSTDLHRCRL
jgi:hypothetical protein